jgi:hypothetical protein
MNSPTFRNLKIIKSETCRHRRQRLLQRTMLGTGTIASTLSFEEEDEARLKKLRLRRRQAILLYAFLKLTDEGKATRKRKPKRKRRDPNVLFQVSIQDGYDSSVSTLTP